MTADLTDQDQDARRSLLRQWLADHGGHAEVVRARSLTTSQASHLSQVVNGYSFGARAARSMEKKLGMSERWLDGTRTPTDRYAPPDLDEALPVVLEALAHAPDRDRLRVALLALLEDDAPAYRQRLAELLAPTGAAGKRHAA